jgi:hypothetical protein
VVEGYLATPTPVELETLARRAYAVETVEGIRYLGSLVLPEDEVCFHVFEAPSVAALLEASERAELAHERLVETVWIPAPRDLERI